MDHVNPVASVLHVDLPARPTHYPIVIEPGSLFHLGSRVKAELPKAAKAMVITDPVVASLYLETAMQSLNRAGLQTVVHITPHSGEQAKTLAGAEAIYRAAQQCGLARTDVIVAMGGGVVGDLAGFCAATFYRGVQFVQVPTTLLALVDSSVGGKVAVNFGHSKNGVGTFYQPALVLIDPDTLNTLPERELKAGLAEVLKYGLIENSIPRMFHSAFADKSLEKPSFLTFLESQFPAAGDYIPEKTGWIELIEACCQMKAAVVEADETETQGYRAILNLGHTFAHAYEEASNYQIFLHGEAVALGLLHACWLSQGLGLLDTAAVGRVTRLSKMLGLIPTFPGNFKPEPKHLLELMRHDKKASSGKITLVLPLDPLGTVILRDDIPETRILEVLNRALGNPIEAEED